ncbi:MAG: tRNA epoxyqueuosine(34) reductase QueG [Bacteroidales bacterium]|nr:tRNA epoxyqueuosine(34) reductase QueG [Bacteroidales bacterium]
MHGPTKQEITDLIKQEALHLGFTACGVATAGKLIRHEAHLKNWLKEGMHGAMGYMENHLEKRLDPRMLVEGARSVIVVAMNYFPTEQQNPGASYLVSKYAYGIDYHFIIKEKLRKLEERLKELAPQHQGRVFTDSAPVLERAWAVQAGLGWTGKNGCLIIPRKGSFFFLGELITNLELTPDTPFEKDFCGNCIRCMEACPAQAIVAPGKLDARRCISYLTIELKDSIPDELRGKMKGRIFGCDICQDVCPHNRFAEPTIETGLDALEFVRNWNDENWKNIDSQSFNRLVKKQNSPLSRIKFKKLRDNIEAAAPGTNH